MSISKLRGKSALGHHAKNDEKTCTKTTTATATATKVKSNTTISQHEAINNDSVAKSLPPASISNANANAIVSETAPVAVAAIHTISQQQQQQQQQLQTYLPQTALLKIEPFVPSLNARLRRPIGRSYSTLSSAYNNHHHLQHSKPLSSITSSNVGLLVGAAIDGGAAAPATAKALSKTTRPIFVGHLRRHPVKVITRQRSKSNSSSASAKIRPSGQIEASSATATATNGVIVTQQPNGICRIARLPKEQDKLPDRINYDRRGLTAIPIFENEPNLRLLSLQHNLINIFHIPTSSPAPSTTASAGSSASSSAETQSGRSRQLATKDAAEAAGAAVNQPSTINNRLSVGLRNERSSSSSSSHPPLHAMQSRLNLCTGLRSTFNSNHLNFTANASIRTVGLCLTPPTSPSPAPAPAPAPALLVANRVQHQMLNRRNTSTTLQCSKLNYNVTTIVAPSKNQLQPQYRFALKRSKSFVTNYSRHLQRTLQKSKQFQRTQIPITPMIANATQSGADDKNMKSFDSASASASCLTTTESNLTIDGWDSQQHGPDDEADDQQESLQITNKQLHMSYGRIFQNLVFLDLYDNQIERIANLDGLPTLSVLLLGKNRITDLSGLTSLRDTLRVLDLHGNKITSISNKINCLQELKSLNLAGNQIRQINQNDFNGLLNLKELNLKRNKIKRINGFQHLIALERLWLCHNELHKVDDMSSIAKAINLLEVTIENNPISLAGDCVSFLVSFLPRLQSLSQMPITEQVRRAAMAWRANKEKSDAIYTNLSTDVFNNIRREEVISNARTNWELLRTQQMMAPGSASTILRSKRSPKQSELAKISESNETAAEVSYADELQEFIKLPPIQQPPQMLTQAQESAGVENFSGSAGSGSSLGPNVDSSSSYFSSDNEESSKSDLETKAGRKRRLGNPLEDVDAKAQQETIGKSSIIMDENANIEILSAQNELTSDISTVVLETKRSAANIIALPKTKERKTKSNNNNNVLRASTQSRCATPITNTGSGSVLSLEFQTNGGGGAAAAVMCNNSSTATTIATATTTIATTALPSMITTTTPCKRYMHGSLMRSQTMAAGGAGTSRTNTSSSSSQANAVKCGGIQIQPQHNAIAVSSSTMANSKAVVNTSASSTSGTGTGNNSTSTTTSNTSNTKATVTEREREQGGDYLIEICGRYLNIYGHGALRFIDKQWNPTKANDVHTLNFSYINFNNITTQLSRIKVRFPHAENFVFRETNISCIGQLNALAELQGITSLFIDPEGNAITTKDLWRQYAIYRLSHWGLKVLNGIDVTDAEVTEANRLHEGLSDLVLWSMPDVMLQPLLARLRLDETCTASKLSPKEWLTREDNKALRLVVGKEALQWKKLNGNNGNFNATHYSNSNYTNTTTTTTIGSSEASSALTSRERGKIHFALMMANTCNAVEKLYKLETLWPSLLLDTVRNTLLDYAQLDVYLRNLMSEIMK